MISWGGGRGGGQSTMLHQLMFMTSKFEILNLLNEMIVLYVLHDRAMLTQNHSDGLVQDCSNSSVLAID